MIDKWYYINLKSRIDKHHAQQITCATWGVPAEKLERLPAAIENDVCPNSRELGQMMIDDGFPEWGETFVSGETKMFPHWIAGNWSMLRAIRLVIEHNENAVISFDTHYMCKLFYLMERELYQLPWDLKILHLTWWKDRTDHPRHMEQQRKLQPTNVEGIQSNFAMVGCGARFFTSRGATEYLELWKKRPMEDTQNVLFYAAADENLSGYYCCDPFWVLPLGDNKPGYDVTRKDKEQIWLS